MLPSIYQPTAFRRLPIQCYPWHHKRRRRRWPMIVLWFILGLLVGWVLRGGGAVLP
jgi:hypothetical protein